MDLETKIAGDITFSNKPGEKMREWRKTMKITQKRLADKMSVSPSVVSDYETGRRSNPGIKMIEKYVNGLIEIDKERGGEFINKYSAMGPFREGNGIIESKEFEEPLSVKGLCEKLNAKIVVKCDLKKKIYGYMIVDAKKAALEMTSWELARMYGKSPRTALIFNNLFSGRASTYGVKVASIVGFKPNLVILNLKGELGFAKKIAEDLRLTLAILHEDIEKIQKKLNKIN